MANLEDSEKKAAVPTVRLTQTISIPLKYVCLFTLVIQTSTIVLALRYSRKTSSSSGQMYLSSTAVVVSEVMKILACIFFLLREANNDLDHLRKNMKEQIFQNWTDSIKLTVPAILYTIQNNLLFLALSYLDAATYQVTYQLKILTTAMFSVLMLGRRLNPLKWISLIVLMLGVALVQMPSGDSKAKTNTKERTISTQLIGLIAVLIACFSSGFAGVYFEKLLKGSKVSLWMRNVLLAFYGILFGVIGVIVNDFSAVRDNGFFQGYVGITWFVVTLQKIIEEFVNRILLKESRKPKIVNFPSLIKSLLLPISDIDSTRAFGGLLVAAVVKYADNILKGFATSISIVISSLFSYYFIGDFEPSLYFIIGATGVLSATYLYSLPASG